jgi:hypothetical protein
VVPGQSTVISGTGCDRGVPVIVTIGGQQVGRSESTSSGAFSTRINPPDIGAGELSVKVSCGPVYLTSIAVVATSKSTSPEGGAAIFGVFILLGFVLLRGQFNGTSRRRRRSGVRLDIEDA